MSLFFPLSIILTIVSRDLFQYSNPFFIFLYFIIFFISATSYCIFIINFFYKARTAAIVGNLIFFGGYFIFEGLNGTGTMTRS